MYAVIPPTYASEVSKYYYNEKHARIDSYNSSNMTIISKEQVRNMLLEEQLI
ncbi:hypothetical protein SDC9_205389 [bioreactor metagenome]|uniref:Uncharacterized protein n=1 Tax=bioreactor metagenome TaxID=1076179 RepID=A0A645J1Y4_9ZZZZ